LESELIIYFAEVFKKIGELLAYIVASTYCVLKFVWGHLRFHIKPQWMAEKG